MIRMSKSTKKTPWTRLRLELAARKERWEIVDANLAKISSPKNVQYAFTKGILHPDENIRDFHFSLIEKAKIPEKEFSKMRDLIFRGMQEDTGKYAKFRAACALAAHGAGKYKTTVNATLRKYVRDPDVGSIAKIYVARLK